jgi:hypothetical protein
MKARAYPKGQFQNAFPEDEFMSMANTGRTGNRTWNKSYVPSTEELATRQQLGEEAMTLSDEAMGGLDNLRVTEGDIPQMTSASEPFAARSASMEAPGLDKLTDEMLMGKHGALVDKVVADFKARGIEPDQEDIVNAINAMINPMRHNYTGANPIGQRPVQRPGPASAEMNSWRDEARMSGLPEDVVSQNPSHWNAKHQRDYLTDTAPEQRAPFARDWQMEELADKRRRQVQDKAEGGMMYSPRDMQAEMMVRGYAGGGYTQEPTLEDIVNHIRSGGTRMDNSADEAMMQSYERRQPSASEYKASPKERISSLGQDFLERQGMGRYKARKMADTVVGGPSSNLPGGFGLADIAMLNPAGAMAVAPMYAAETGHYLGKGDPVSAGMSSLGMLPMAQPIRKAYRGFNK